MAYGTATLSGGIEWRGKVRWRPLWFTEPVTPGDLTVIVLTLNKPPAHWQRFYQQRLCEVIGDRPLVIVTKEPLDWGRPNTTYLYQEEPPEGGRERMHNIYVQTLRALEVARTPYVATLDDDSLYPAEHFDTFRPPADKFGYNYSRWMIHEWKRRRPFYYYAPTPETCLLIAPRDLYLSRLTEASHSGGLIGRGNTEWLFDRVEFYTHEPVLCFHHTRGLAGEHAKWRKPWPIQAFDIPRWGRAKDIIREWREDD